MRKYVLILFAAGAVFTNYGCDKCKDIACTTPPPTFSFQLLDKDSGEDLVANGSFEANHVNIYSIADSYFHSIRISTTADSTAYFFADLEIGWKPGPENASYELHLNDSTVYPFTYLTKEENTGCCTSIKLESFELAGVERLFIPEQNLFQFRF